MQKNVDGTRLAECTIGVGDQLNMAVCAIILILLIIHFFGLFDSATNEHFKVTAVVVVVVVVVVFLSLSGST